MFWFSVLQHVDDAVDRQVERRDLLARQLDVNLPAQAAADGDRRDAGDALEARRQDVLREFAQLRRDRARRRCSRRARPMIGVAFESNFWTTGGSASSGRRPRTRSMRVRMSFIASLRSVPQVKFIEMLALPSCDVEFICSSPDTALSCCSSGRVISSSISSGPTPV